MSALLPSFFSTSRALRGLLVVSALGWPAIGVADPAWVASLGATSDYVHRGLTQSSGEPAVQASAGVTWPTGVSLAAWVSSIDTSELEPDIGDGTGVEVDVIAGYAWPLSSRWQMSAEVGHYTYQGTDRGLDYDYTEAAVALSWRDRVRVSVAATPEATDHTRAGGLLRGPRTVVDVSAEWPLGRGFSAAGGLGYADASAVAELHYVYGSAGVNWRRGRYLAALSLIGTDDRARQRYADGRADTRAVASVAVFFSGTLRR